MNDKNSNESSRKQRVLVNVILDKSGSMCSKVDDVIGGFNLYLDELAKEPTVDYGFSLTLFDTVVEMRYKNVALAKVAKLDAENYLPGGNTALFDAVGNTVQTVKTDGFDKVITVIMTDGEENSSREWTMQGVRDLIAKKEGAGNWTFVFLGANLDAFAQGASLGVAVPNVVRYDPAHYRGVYSSLAKNTNMFSSSPQPATPDFFQTPTPGIKKMVANLGEAYRALRTRKGSK
ncbi:MAG TPA: vWA domain-containing protein [Candidatus Sulfotelmatobacter sp.]|nr:vWA domain-containing protein [Candidatus Sulfotelmatobacter sp.]